MERTQQRLVSDLYWKNSEGTLIPNKEILKQRGRPAKLFMFLEDEDTRLVPKKLMNWSNENKAYRELIKNLNIAYSDNDLPLRNEPVTKDHIYKRKESWLYWDEIPDSVKAKVIELLKLEFYSQKSVAALFDLDMSQVKCILKHFEKSIEIQLDAQRTTKYIQRTALNEEQIYWIKTYLENSENKRVIVRQIKIALEKRFPEIGTISSSTIRRVLKRKLWHTYKKLNKRHAASVSQSSAQKFLESYMTLKTLEESGWELIYFDGFGYDPRKQQFYGWWRKGSKGYVKVYDDPINMTFIVTVSKLHLYGVMSISGTWNSDCIVHFLKMVCYWRNSKPEVAKNKFLFVADNASVHTSSEIVNFVSKSGLRLLTIAPYSPALNPSEVVINWIKSKLRQMQSQNM